MVSPDGAEFFFVVAQAADPRAASARQVHRPHPRRRAARARDATFDVPVASEVVNEAATTDVVAIGAGYLRRRLRIRIPILVVVEQRRLIGV